MKIVNEVRTADGVSTVASYPISFGSHCIVRADLKTYIQYKQSNKIP